MTEEQLIQLHANNNVIGIHTVNHPVQMHTLTLEEQFEEYSTCQKRIKSIIGELPTTVSYPLGRYNRDTLEVMKKLDIELAVTTNENLPAMRLEFPRRDHANVLREMQGRSMDLLKGRYQYPFGGMKLGSDENTKVIRYERDLHPVVCKALQAGFGKAHPVTVDRNLFEWQYRGGEFVVASRNPLGACGYTYCKADDPILGVGHNCWQQMMWYVEPSPYQFEVALQMLFAPVCFQRQLMDKNPLLDIKCSSFVLGINAKSAVPIYKNVEEYKVIDPIPRLIKILAADKNGNNNNSVRVWQNPNPLELERFWLQLQVSPHVMTATHRNADYWLWRYISCPNIVDEDADREPRYIFFKLEDEPLSSSGLVVARFEYNYALRLIEVIPPQWNPTHPKFETLLKGILSYAFDKGYKIADFWCTHKGIGDYLSAKGWYNQFDHDTPSAIANTPMIFTSDGQGRDAKPLNLAFAAHGGRAQDSSLWYFVKSDSDMDRPPHRVPRNGQRSALRSVIPQSQLADVVVLGSSTLDWVATSLTEELSAWGSWSVWSCPYNGRSSELCLPGSRSNNYSPKWLILVDQPVDILHRWDMESIELVKPFETALDEYLQQIHSYVENHPETKVLILKMLINAPIVMAKKSATAAAIKNFNAVVKAIEVQHTNVFTIDPFRATPFNASTQVYDIAMWVTGKYTFSLPFSQLLARLFRQYITAGEGLSPRLIILDLDDTLWGGVLGEDGIFGVKITEDYLMLHRFLRQVRSSSGVMLAIASRNDMKLVTSAFASRSDETPLRLEEDFVFTRCNWGSKASNVKEILQSVNLKPHHAIFVDDNDANLEEVQAGNPGIRVVKAENPLKTLTHLQEHVGMVTLTLSKSDFIRTKQVQSQVKVLSAKKSYSSPIEFFGSLKCVVTFHPLEPKYLERTQQLIGKTNQFNLNGIRWQLKDLAKQESCKIYAIEHVDKFSEKEVVGVIALQTIEAAPNVRVWATSCRVLGKGVELIILKGVLSLLAASAVKTANFELIDTGKNNAILDFFRTHCSSKNELETSIFTKIAPFSHILKLPDIDESILPFEIPVSDMEKNVYVKGADRVPKDIVKGVWGKACEMVGQSSGSQNEKEFDKLNEWSSIIHMRFLSQIKRMYNIDIYSSEISETMNFSQLCRLVHSKLENQPLRKTRSNGTNAANEKGIYKNTSKLENKPLPKTRSNGTNAGNEKSRYKNTSVIDDVVLGTSNGIARNPFANMHSLKLLASRQFSYDDQVAFGKLSHDTNPIHLDHIVARRLMFGQIIVHGIHTMLYALDVAVSTYHADGLCGDILEIKAKFPGEVTLLKRLDIYLCSDISPGKRTNSVVIRGKVGSKPVLELYVRFSGKSVNSITKLSSTRPDEKIVELTEQTLVGAKGGVCVTADAGLLTKLFPSLKKNINLIQIGELLCLSYIVGMRCPGLHSIFSQFSMVKTGMKVGGETEMLYEAKNIDFPLLDVGILGPSLQGTLSALFRPPPKVGVLRKGIMSLGIGEKEFASQRALIVGGSRGLGEATAMILATGGADVAVSYCYGSEDAKNVLSKMQSVGSGSFSVCQINVIAEDGYANLSALNNAPTHVYYFASPRIQVDKFVPFDNSVFEKLSEYYIKNFLRLIETLKSRFPDSHCTFYVPSTVFLSQQNPPPGTASYCAAKAAMEIACKNQVGVNIIVDRLGRADTDQNQSLIQLHKLRPAAHIMLESIREKLAEA
jgi:FkbH-like protein